MSVTLNFLSHQLSSLTHLALGTLDQLGANLLEGLGLAAGQGDADLVDLGRLAEVLVSLVVRHLGDFFWLEKELMVI